MRLICAFALLASDSFAQISADERTGETKEIGAQRVLESSAFLGRFTESYTNWGEVDYPRQIGITSNLRNYYSLMGDPLVYGRVHSVGGETRVGRAAICGFIWFAAE